MMLSMISGYKMWYFASNVNIKENVFVSEAKIKKFLTILEKKKKFRRKNPRVIYEIKRNFRTDALLSSRFVLTLSPL